MDRSEQIKNGILRLSMVLLSLTMLSLCVVKRTFARYSASSTFHDSARVARFVFQAADMRQDQNFAISLFPDKKESVKIELQNDSEVALRCTVHFSCSGNMPVSFIPTQCIQSLQLSSQEEDSWTLELQPGKERKVLDFSVQMAEKSYQYSGCTAQFGVLVTAEQID